jgi:hypothetical protein
MTIFFHERMAKALPQILLEEEKETSIGPVCF